MYLQGLWTAQSHYPIWSLPHLLWGLGPVGPDFSIWPPGFGHLCKRSLICLLVTNCLGLLWSAIPCIPTTSCLHEKSPKLPGIKCQRTRERIKVNDKVLILGGCRSGKSRFALEKANSYQGYQKIFLATSSAYDEEM